MTTIAPARRLSPRVRRLLAEHDVEGRGVAGTGASGRLRPRDVLTAAGVPRPPAAGAVLASPLARRLLHDAGIDLADAVAGTEGRRLTRARAEAVIEEQSVGARGAAADGVTRSARRRAGAAAVETDVDVAELLAVVGAAQPAFAARHGSRLGLGPPVAIAVAAAVARDPGRGARSGTDEAAGVVIALHESGPDGARLRVVRDAQDLTVAGLARRAASATPAPIGDPGPDTPTVVVTTDPTAPVEALLGAAGLGVVEVGEPAPRDHRGTDRLGHRIVTTHPHVTVRLHHHDRDEDAHALLTIVSRALASWTLPVGP